MARAQRKKQRELESCIKEAAERYADTSWKIHQDWYKKEPTISESTLKPKPKTSNGVNVNNNIDEIDHYSQLKDVKNGTITNGNVAKIPQTQVRKVIEIQTVQTTCEPVFNKRKEDDEAVRNYLETHL